MQLVVKNESSLLDYIQAELKIKSKSKIRLWLKSGQVSVNGIQIKKADHALRLTDKIEIGEYEPNKNPKTESWFKIYYEDDFLLVAHKPAGILTIDVNSKTYKTFFHEVSSYIREKDLKAKKLFLVHRLDLEVEGLIIFAKTAKMQEALKDDWQNTEKLYYALVEGSPSEDRGTIQSWLHESEERLVFSGPKTAASKLAITHFESVKKLENGLSLLLVKLGSGRKNQIRVHLSEMGCPIVGDYRYGADDKVKRQIRLMAFSIEFTHPFTQKRIKLSAEPSKRFMHPSNEDEKY